VDGVEMGEDAGAVVWDVFEDRGRLEKGRRPVSGLGNWRRGRTNLATTITLDAVLYLADELWCLSR